MDVLIPPEVQQFFWGDDLHALSWKDHKHYIMQTLLDKGGAEALSWLFRQTTKDDIRQSLPTFHLSQKSSNFWKTYLS